MAAAADRGRLAQAERAAGHRLDLGVQFAGCPGARHRVEAGCEQRRLVAPLERAEQQAGEVAAGVDAHRQRMGGARALAGELEGERRVAAEEQHHRRQPHQ